MQRRVARRPPREAPATASPPCHRHPPPAAVHACEGPRAPPGSRPVPPLPHGKCISRFHPRRLLEPPGLPGAGQGRVRASSWPGHRAPECRGPVLCRGVGPCGEAAFGRSVEPGAWSLTDGGSDPGPASGCDSRGTCTSVLPTRVAGHPADGLSVLDTSVLSDVFLQILISSLLTVFIFSWSLKCRKVEG